MADLINKILSKKIECHEESKFLSNLDQIDANFGRFNISIMGIGGAGCNAISHMIKTEKWDDNVKFWAINTDIGALRKINRLCNTLLIGIDECKGGGSGGNPKIGEMSAESAEKELINSLTGTNLLFLVSGMGKGTGSGSTPIIAKIAKSMNIPTISILNMPSVTAEGRNIYDVATQSYKKVIEKVDSVCVINNDNIINNSSIDISLVTAFYNANDEIKNIVSSIVKMINTTTAINIDFNDIVNFFKSTKYFTFLPIVLPNSKYNTQNLYEKINETIANSYCDININNAQSIVANIDVSNNASYKILKDIKRIFVKLSHNINLWSINGINYHDNNDENIYLNILVASKEGKNEYLDLNELSDIENDLVNNQFISKIKNDNANLKEKEQKNNDGIETINFLNDQKIENNENLHNVLDSNQCIEYITSAIKDTIGNKNENSSSNPN